jgi:AcrR family transcriptional regulator
MSIDTKHNLLKVSRELIDTKGIDAISMRTVGREANLSRGALYRHFENKESLLAAIVVENFNILNGKFIMLDENTKNPKQFLFKLCLAYYDFGINNPDHYQLMFSTKWDDSKYPDIRQAAVGIFNKVAFYISNVLNSKQLKKKILLEKTAILYAFIHGIVELHLAGHSEADKGLNDIAGLINNILDSILG